MNVSECVRAESNALRSYKPMVCGSCGSDTLSGSQITFCANCEAIVGNDAKTFGTTNPATAASFTGIRTALQKGDFEGASAIYDQLLKDNQSPQLLYGKGMLYIEYSNFTVSQISYNGGGFMEGNSELRTKASLLVSEAKRLLAKSLSISEKESKEAPSPYTFYRMFLCDLKANNLRAANDHLSKMASDKSNLVQQYARMAFYSYAGMHKEAHTEIEKVLRTQNPPANVFYYAAFNAFKMGDPAGSEKIMFHSGDLIEDSKKVPLLQAIKFAAADLK